MICLDTTFIIDFLKGRKQAIDAFEKYKESHEFVSTEINVFEVFEGVFLKQEISLKERLKVSEFFNTMKILSFGMGCGERGAMTSALLEKTGFTIGDNDIFIASIMLEHGCTKILTKNKRHFSQIKGIEVIEY